MATLSNVNIGTSPNDGTGDDLRTAFTTVNTNFQAISGIFPDVDVANLEANITSTGTSTFNILNGTTIAGDTVSASTIGNSGATLIGTISTAAQPSITSLGTLTSLTVNGTITHTGQNVDTVTLISSGPYNVVDTDSLIIANLIASGNITATLPNAANSTGRHIGFSVYAANLTTSDVRLTITTGVGEPEIYVTANAAFPSTDIGPNTGIQRLRLISSGEYWITT